MVEEQITPLHELEDKLTRVETLVFLNIDDFGERDFENEEEVREILEELMSENLVRRKIDGASDTFGYTSSYVLTERGEEFSKLLLE